MTLHCSSLHTQSVLPFFVATKMTKIRKPTLDKPTPERYVAAELSTVGLQNQTNGYFPHAIMVSNHIPLENGQLVLVSGVSGLSYTGAKLRFCLGGVRNLGGIILISCIIKF